MCQKSWLLFLLKDTIFLQTMCHFTAEKCSRTFRAVSGSYHLRAISVFYRMEQMWRWYGADTEMLRLDMLHGRKKMLHSS